MSMNPLSRRSLFGLGAAALGTVALSAAPSHAAVRPAVVWGSSSARGMYADEPAGFRKVSLWHELTALGVPTTHQAFSGWRSPELLAVRSEAHPLRPNFGFAGAHGTLPGSGSLILPTHDDVEIRVALSGSDREVPGTIKGIPVSVIKAQNRFGKNRFTRTKAGAPVHIGNDPKWVTGLEELERGKTHLLWIGKNNIKDVSRVLSDTRAAYDVEPETTLVLGHWMNWWDRRGTANYSAVTAVNDGYQRAYGSRYVDIQAAMWSRQLWRDLPEIRALGLEKVYADGKRQRLGPIPKQLIASDTVHLNAYGYLIAAHAVHRKLRELRWA